MSSKSFGELGRQKTAAILGLWLIEFACLFVAISLLFSHLETITIVLIVGFGRVLPTFFNKVADIIAKD